MRTGRHLAALLGVSTVALASATGAAAGLPQGSEPVTLDPADYRRRFNTDPLTPVES